MTDKFWGFIENGEFVMLPKQPMITAELGPPPFDVTLPSGELRHVIEEPDDSRKKRLRLFAPYGEMCRDPDLCWGKGYCPRDPTCGD